MTSGMTILRAEMNGNKNEDLNLVPKTQILNGENIL